MNKITILLIFFFISFHIDAQNKWQSKKEKIVIPFALVHNLIILEVEMNDGKLDLMLDTGSENSLLFSVPENDSIVFHDTRKVRIGGLGNGEYIEAMVSSKNKMKIKEYVDEDFELLLITDKDIKLVNRLGISVNGILGSSFFKDFLVEIDYQNQKIILHKRMSKKVAKKISKYKSKNVNIIESKPYFDVSISLNNNKFDRIKLLMDTGLGDGLWLFENDSIKCDTQYFNDLLGIGLGGDIIGKKSRVHKLEFSDHLLEEALVSYPDSSSLYQLDLINGRNGSIGGGITKRFNWILDYKNQIFYFKKNKFFEEPFNYNMSGIEVQHTGLTWVPEKLTFNNYLSKSGTIVFDKDYDFKYKFELKPIFEVFSVRENSPGSKVGIEKGDIIISINGKKGYDYTIQEISNLFQSEDGKLIKMEVDRNGQIFKVRFYLEKVL